MKMHHSDEELASWVLELRRIVIAAFVLAGCADRSLEVDAYAPCRDSEECPLEATCVDSGQISVCRPECAVDSDCPGVEERAGSCGLDGHASGQCVVPAGDGCPNGMIAAQIDTQPTSPLVCVWET